MIIEFFGKNFGCFRDEFRLSMLATDIDRDSDRGIVEVDIEGEDEPLRLLRSAAIYGPNASGKSTVLRAARALGFLIHNSAQMASDEDIRPYEPFMLDAETKSQPVCIGIKAVVHRRVFKYVVEFERSRVVSEVLERIGPDSDQLLFERRNDRVEGDWQNDPRFALLSDSLRSNALLLSLADTITPGLVEGVAVGIKNRLRCFDPAMNHWGPTRARIVAKQVADDVDGFGGWLLELLRNADLGIVGIIPDKAPVSPLQSEEHPSRHQDDEYILNLLHEGADGSFKLPYNRESLGTQKTVELSLVLHSLCEGQEMVAWFVDEIGASMHPQQLESFIRLINCDLPDKQIKGQLIFATHETSLLDDQARDAVLRRDQVYFTEKDQHGASHLYSVSDFKERQNLNLRRRYLQGRYGALPAIGDFGARNVGKKS